VVLRLTAAATPICSWAKIGKLKSVKSSNVE
jgi:hypothetical protein